MARTKAGRYEILSWAGILLAQFVLFYLLSASRPCVAFFEKFFEWRKVSHQNLFSNFAFSVGDVFYIVLTAAFVLLLFFIIVKKKWRRQAFLTLMILLNAFYFAYQILWGMLYFSTPIIQRLPPGEPSLSEAKYLAKTYLDKSIASRKNVSEDRNGVFRIRNLACLKKEIIGRQPDIPHLYNDKKPANIPDFKPSLFKWVMSDTGIMGYYNPFSAEAQYNPELPASALPFTLAHESAHQLGFAREEEANFIGFQIGRDSPDPDLRYSAELFALKSLLRQIYPRDSAFVKDVLRDYSPGMQRDRLYEKRFARRHAGIMDAFFGFTNDLFLKGNRQEGAVTYSYFTDLLIRSERRAAASNKE